MESMTPAANRGGLGWRLVRCIGVGAVAAMIAIGAPVAASAADAGPENQLTADQVQQRADALAEKYTEVGQLLTVDDANFVRTYLVADPDVARSVPGTPSVQAAQAAGSTTVKATGKGGGLGSIAIVAALVWFVGAVIRRIVGHRLERRKKADL